MRRTTFSAFLTILFLVTVGCEKETKDTTMPTAISNKGAGISLSTSSQIPSIYLDSLDYEESHGILYPGNGAFLELIMRTWPDACRFMIRIPQDALPDGHPETPIPFSIRVPTYESYMEHEADNLPLIVRMEPSNLDFQTNVMVYVTYMPWVRPNSDFPYGFGPDFDIYDNAVVAVYTRTRVELIMSVPHFSDWVVIGDDDD